jgi:formate dehydrogenase subunit delta
MDSPATIRMANRIAEFFAAMPERDEAVDGVAQHLRRFWTPAMRRELLAIADTPQASLLHPLVLAALERPPERTSP